MTQRFNINDFPIETDQPIIEVNLPVGQHILELVVEDSAGLRSAPSTVQVTVEQAPPVITDITPKTGLQGSTGRGQITGQNLLGISQVVFSGSGVTASILPNGTNTSVPVEITVTPQAAVGGRTFEVVTPGGRASSPTGLEFSVQQNLPVITGITPNSGRQGTTVSASIQGSHLAGASAVNVLGGGVTATIQPGGTNTNLPVRFDISPTAANTARQFTVTTPGGQAQSPASVTFTVGQGAPSITGISPSNGAQGDGSLTVNISGDSLSNASDLTFSGTGVTVNRIVSSADNRLTADIAVASSARPGARTYSVTTPGGRASSPAGAEFTVQQAVPEIQGISPSSGSPGDRLNVVISGVNLSGTRSVAFDNPGITVNTISGSSDTSVSLNVSIAANAQAGASSFKLETPGGSAASPQNVAFTVEQAPPAITGIRPGGGEQGVSTLQVTISGRNLSGATSVEFQETDIKMLRLVSATDTVVTADITIAANAATTRRGFSVVTPQGNAVSPPSVTFEVLAAPPTIRGIDPNSAQVGQTINAVIAGTNLAGATSIRFTGTGVTGAIRGRSTDTSVPVSISIDRTAAPGSRTFVLQTTQGTVDSGSFRVAFTVIPIITTIRPTINPTIFPTVFPFTPVIATTISPTLRATVAPTFQPILRTTTVSPTISRLTSFTSTTRTQPVDAISGIGPTSRARLEAGGIRSVGDLANAQATDVARLLRTTEVRAQGFIDAARNM